ncbi:hypothetical protein [Promicromonospora sp. NPDC023987]|uniref:hypothetical protein n=1 Tax=Promicromonospora sp. NPDC023987 TaxID=3155360 RepID=UPI0033C317B6
MSLQKRALAALSGVLMAFLVALGGIPAAQASDGAQDATRVMSSSENGRELRAASAADADAGVLANPGVSPAPEKTAYNRSLSQAWSLVDACPSGRFCTYQREDDGQYRVYQFYRCGDYRLSYWGDSRDSHNNQTGGVTVRLLGSSGQQVNSVAAGQQKYVNWDPVWTIRLCG